jgi:hypothetical protein
VEFQVTDVAIKAVLRAVASGQPCTTRQVQDRCPQPRPAGPILQHLVEPGLVERVEDYPHWGLLGGRGTDM